MSVELLVTGTICSVVLLATLAGVGGFVLRQAKDRPRPWQEQLAELDAKQNALSIRTDELQGALARMQQREAKQRQRDNRPDPEEPEREAVPPKAPQNPFAAPAASGVRPPHPASNLPPHLLAKELQQRRGG